jgi:deoxyadenosine/deoxycytidine kinase
MAPISSIAVEGLIGAGQTTTARLLATQLGATFVAEDWASHPFLDTFKADRHRFASEVAFALLQYRAMRHAAAHPLVVSDFALGKSAVFAHLGLPAVDRALLVAVLTRLMADTQVPDIVIFLDVPPATCLERIRLRARPTEADLTLSYLVQLREAYLRCLPSLGKNTVALNLAGTEHPQMVCLLSRAAMSRSTPRRDRPGAT